MTEQLETVRPKYLGIARCPPRQCPHQLARIAFEGAVHRLCRHCGHTSEELVALAVDELRSAERRALLALLQRRAKPGGPLSR